MNNSSKVNWGFTYEIVCKDPEGNVKWTDKNHNIVTTAGLNDVIDVYLRNQTQTATWYVGLTDGTPTVAAGDTMASHAGWTEVTAYSESVRANPDPCCGCFWQRKQHGIQSQLQRQCRLYHYWRGFHCVRLYQRRHKRHAVFSCSLYRWRQGSRRRRHAGSNSHDHRSR